MLQRDGSHCVVCGAVAIDVHHLIGRRLWPDGGYYVANGVSLCGRDESDCHLRAEQTLISVEELRAAARISEVVLPAQLDSRETYDKWGNVTVANGRRHSGDLFTTEQVQKVLAAAGRLELFDRRFKQPRTPHLP